MSGASERANGRESGPAFLVILAHSAVEKQIKFSSCLVYYVFFVTFFLVINVLKAADIRKFDHGQTKPRKVNEFEKKMKEKHWRSQKRAKGNR